MKKMNKKGFTLVEIMIVVAIIGLLAAIGIPSIIGAYANAQEKTMARNVADVEKAKGVITLPVDANNPIAGAMGAAPVGTNVAFTADQITGICRAMKFDDEAALRAALKVGNSTISLGDWETKASY